jgi:hypothetical protein
VLIRRLAFATAPVALLAGAILVAPGTVSDAEARKLRNAISTTAVGISAASRASRAGAETVTERPLSDADEAGTGSATRAPRATVARQAPVEDEDDLDAAPAMAGMPLDRVVCIAGC